MSVRLSIQGGSDVTMTVLNNIERSIREFNIERASIEWSSDNALDLKAQATAYYMDEASIIESSKTFNLESKK